MCLNPYLTFRGQCEAAFRFYEQCLGGKILTMMTYGDSPMAKEVPQEWHTKILHTTLALGDYVLQGADVPQAHYQPPQGFFVMLQLRDAAEAERIFNTLARQGAVQTPWQQTFWALRFGALVDQFGTRGRSIARTLPPCADAAGAEARAVVGARTLP